MNTNGNSTLCERVSEMYKFAISEGFAASKSEFAEKCGVTNVTLSRYLNGKQEPALKTLQSMNVAMGCPFNDEWLFYGKGDMVSKKTMPNVASEDGLAMLVQEMRETRLAKDNQIDRLLRIIEKMQQQQSYGNNETDASLFVG